MVWKNSELNEYPNILLHDCFIRRIEIKNRELVLTFSEYGFFKLDKQKNNYYRTNGGEIKIENCRIDDINIGEIRTQHLSEDIYFDTIYDIKIEDFFEKINSGKWMFEVIEEFYAGGSCIFTGMMGADEDRSWCYIKLYFKNLVYQWNDIRYDWPY